MPTSSRLRLASHKKKPSIVITIITIILQRLWKWFWPEHKKENWEWNKKKIVCLFKKIPATNIISVYSYTGSMAFGPNVSKPENENWNSYGDSSAGNSLCKNCIFGINK